MKVPSGGKWFICACNKMPCTCGAEKCNKEMTLIVAEQNDGMKLQTIGKMKDELKRLIKHWKKEAECHLLYEDTGDLATTLIYEKCAEDLEKTLLWH